MGAGQSGVALDVTHGPACVLFDLGDVVARYDPTPRFDAYADRTGLDASEVRRRLMESGFSAACDRGEFDADAMHEGIEERLGRVFARAELLKLQAAAFVVDREVLAIAAEVGRSRRAGLLTNNAALLECAFAREFPELVATFDPVLFSWRFGCAKPDPEIFAAAGERLGVPAYEILFIDDQERHVRAALRAGWSAIVFTTPTALRDSLREFGVGIEAK